MNKMHLLCNSSCSIFLPLDLLPQKQVTFLVYYSCTTDNMRTKGFSSSSEMENKIVLKDMQKSNLVCSRHVSGITFEYDQIKILESY